MGGLRGNSCKSRTGEAIGSGRESPEPWLGGMAAQGLFGFFLWIFTSRFLRAAGPLGWNHYVWWKAKNKGEGVMAGAESLEGRMRYGMQASRGSHEGPHPRGGGSSVAQGLKGANRAP